MDAPQEISSNYRHRAYHKTGYQMPATSHRPVVTDAAYPLEKSHRLVAHFAHPGIERNAGATGFAYGSEKSYSKSQERYRERRLDDRTSAELLKLKKQQKEAEQDIEEHQRRKARQLQEKAAEKRRDLEMLQNYKPWGKGSGAPRATLSGTKQTRRQRFDFEAWDGCGYDPFGKAGGGAPLKTGSGKLQTSLKTDPDIRFQDQLKKEVNDTLRYKPDGAEDIKAYYTPKEEQFQRKDSEYFRKVEERDKQIKYAKKLEEQQTEVLERKTKERAEVKETHSNYPWGKNMVDRDESGKIKPRRQLLGKDILNTTPEFPGLAAQLGRQGAGAPLRDNAGKPHTRIAGIKTVAASCQNKDTYDPWGRPGGGAPLKNRTGVYGACSERRSAHEQVVADKREAGRGYGMDVASWMRTGEVGMPKTRDPATGQLTGANRNTSDVTANQYNIRRTCTQSNDGRCREYFTDLQLQADHRHKELQRQKEAERKLELEHVERVAKMWDGGETKVRSRQRPREDDEERTKQAGKRMEYYNELQKMIDDQNNQRKNTKANTIQSEREHITTFNQVWGRPGAGAPRLNHNGQLETAPRNTSMMKAHVYDGWHFRRT